MAQENFEIRGELVEHGKAPFRHAANNNPSYYVTTQGSSGKEHTQWGSDLERAIKVSGASLGDKIHVKEDTSLTKLDEKGSRISGSKVVYDIDITEKAPKAFEIRGELVAHGKAPFKNDSSNGMSYYVTTESKGGKEHTQWGTDLERAVKESNAKVGDKVHLSHTGSRYYSYTNDAGESVKGSKLYYDLNVTSKGNVLNEHLEALNSMPELKRVSESNKQKLAELRLLTETHSKGDTNAALNKFDNTVINASSRKEMLASYNKEATQSHKEDQSDSQSR